jgi:pimeloyl-ACP methyl ester carboxylesterase
VGQGPAVVFIHGYLMDHTMFGRQVTALAPQYRVISWDQRGHGGFLGGRGGPLPARRTGRVQAGRSDPGELQSGVVGGTAASKATEAALAAYPGGVVDRVVKLSNGEYEVHYIGVNWPHHIFVNQDLKVVGAN